MARNLWIGKPGLLREITQAAKSWDRGAELNVSEFKSLEGQITTIAPARTARRLKFAWDWLEPADAEHLIRLARRVNGPGMLGRNVYAGRSVVVIDPAAVNLLDPYQAAGQTLNPGGHEHWFTVQGAITISPTVDDVVVGSCDNAATKIGWRHGVWPGWPVMPGMRISWLLPPDWDSEVATAQLDWKDVDGTYLSTTSAAGPLVTGTAPAGAAFVTPVGAPGRTGLTGLAGASLTIGEEPVALSLGDGCPAMAVTGYTETPATRLPYRSVSIDLVEVAGAAL
ncbi:hypothetical protein [Streptomyces liangshanensis]|uniref:Uncharacterized protein n=1 Tax=Streptomyces liangshanensis TaxID=2717324 RepID=A0A6G9H2C9_9ACTN|nr:hypothetical protein [Streptomyces liangshanensis]QIQ04693.1 hypothetical protein HA039_22540 [Streptomyces liangshanensis]